MMKVIPTQLNDVFVIEMPFFGDERGFFMESFNQRQFDDAIGISTIFVQDNHSKSSQGVLRGLHYQVSSTQGKLVRVIAGRVFDVVVDLRKSSTTFGKWQGFELSGDNKKQLWIPEGFAHGFLSLTDNVEFVYKTTDYYSPNAERTIMWNDSELGIDWPIDGLELVISEKDQAGVSFSDAQVFE